MEGQSSDIMDILSRQVKTTNESLGDPVENFNVLVASQYPKKRDSSLFYIDAAGGVYPVKRFTAIGSARRFAINFLNHFCEDELRLRMIEFAIMANFLIKYIECMEIDIKVGVDRKKSQIYFLEHKGEIDRYPYDDERLEIENKTNELLERYENHLNDIFK